jgi:hypothetical protein
MVLVVGLIAPHSPLLSDAPREQLKIRPRRAIFNYPVLLVRLPRVFALARGNVVAPIALLRTLKRNPLECWAMQHFEQSIVAGGVPIGRALLVHEPGAIRHVLLENAANYRKDRLQPGCCRRD